MPKPKKAPAKKRLPPDWVMNADPEAKRALARIHAILTRRDKR